MKTTGGKSTLIQKGLSPKEADAVMTGDVPPKGEK